MPASPMGWLRHVLTLLALAIFILGCALIGYMAWVLASSVSVTRFIDGTLIFTYVVIALGFVLFFSGLLGWVGGFSESVCLVRLFYLSLVLSIVAEIGGLIALAIINVSLPQVVGIGWQEVNQGTRNIVQRNLNCCGWNGPKDFAYTNDPIDESCYETVVRSNSGIWPRGSSHSNGGITFEDENALSSRLKVVDGPTVPTKKMKEDGCGELLVGWFRSNKLIWATILASLIALQLMATGIAMYILSRVKKLRKLRKSRTMSRRHLYDSSSEGSNEYRPRI